MPETLSSPPSESASDSAARVPQKHKRLYDILCIVAIVNVACFALLWNTRKIIDFRSFYSAGHIALTSPSQVYNAEAQRQEQKKLPNQGGWIPYFHPPMELLLFAPLARLPYRVALSIWTAISGALFLASIAVLSSIAGIDRRKLLTVSLALSPTCFVLYEGQDTFLLLLLLCVVLFLVQRKQEIGAGIVLSLALFKPQIPIVLALAFLLRGRKKLTASFTASSALIALASLAAIGGSGLRQLLELIRYREPLDQTWRMPNLRGLVSFVHAPQPIAIAVSILVLAAFAMDWHRREQSLLHVACSAILVGALTSHHFHGYDLALLIIPVAILLSDDFSRSTVAVILCLGIAPVYFLLVATGAPSLLAIAIFVLALHPVIQTWRRSARAAS